MLRHIYGMIVCVVLVIPAIADAFLFPQKLSRRVDGPLPGSPAYGGQPLAEWISLLDSKDQQVRREALIARVSANFWAVLVVWEGWRLRPIGRKSFSGGLCLVFPEDDPWQSFTAPAWTKS
jgi:hypothetical protein